MVAKSKQSDEKQAIEPSDVPFEHLLERIETVVGKLEQGETPLEESLHVYEQGAALIREAQQRLGRMEAKVEELTAEGDTNSPA
ncbi:MAG: exodeoxyribonuclease VII small subunit [Myxococcota bacterium]